MYESRKKARSLIGESSVSLAPLLPWVADSEAAAAAVAAQDDLLDRVDLKRVGGVLAGARGLANRGQALMLGMGDGGQGSGGGGSREARKRAFLRSHYLGIDREEEYEVSW